MAECPAARSGESSFVTWQERFFGLEEFQSHGPDFFQAAHRPGQWIEHQGVYRRFLAPLDRRRRPAPHRQARAAASISPGRSTQRTPPGQRRPVGDLHQAPRLPRALEHRGLHPATGATARVHRPKAVLS